MGEQTSARNAAALRREARKKKILENLTSRLKLIEGIHSSSESSTLANYESEVTNDIVDPPLQSETLFNKNIVIRSEEHLTNIFGTRNAVGEDEDLNITSGITWKESNDEIKNNFLLSGLLNDEESNNNNYINNNNSYAFMIAYKKKLHYILLAMIVNILLFFNKGHLFFNNIFCPFWTVKIIEILSGKQEQGEMKVLIYLIVSSLPKELQETGKSLLSVFSPIFSDLFLYIFTFIIGFKILEMLLL